MGVTQWLQETIVQRRRRGRSKRQRFEDFFNASLVVKPLESRLLLSATHVTLDNLTGDLLIADTDGNNDALTVESDTANSRYIIRDAGADLTTDIAGAADAGNTIYIPFNSVTGSQIIANTGDGDDSVTLDFTLGSFSKDVAVNLGSGNDTFNTTGSTTLAAGVGSLSVDGQADIDTANLNADLTLAANKNLSVAGETINVGLNANMLASGTGSMSLSAGKLTMLGGSSFVTVNQSITIHADDMTLATGASGATINAGTSGTVHLGTLTSGAAVTLGPTTDAIANNLELSDAELDRITAGTLNVGDANTGTITFTAAIGRPANSATNINVTTGALGSNIVFAAGSLTSASAHVTLTTPGSIVSGSAANDVNAGTAGVTLLAAAIGASGNPFAFAATSTTNGISASTNGNQFLSTTTGSVIGPGGLNAGIGIIELNGAGTFVLGGDERIADTSRLHINGGGEFSVGAFTETVGGLTLTSGTVAGTGTLTSLTDYAVLSGRIDAVLAGSVGLTKTGPGTVTLAAANTYTGKTEISAGVLEAAILADGLQASSIGASSGDASNLVLGNGSTAGTLRYIGTGANTDRLFTIATTSLTADTVIASSGSGALSFTNQGSVIFAPGPGTNRDLVLAGSNAGLNTFAPLIEDFSGVGTTTSLFKQGAGTWVLANANSYTGATTISGGVLSASVLTDNGTNSSIGAGTTLLLNGGTLRYTGSGGSTDRTVQLGATAGSTLDASGAGAISFTAALTYAGTTARTLTLTGSNTGSNTIGPVNDVSGTQKTSVTKTGPGHWLISGSYTGSTTVAAGTLLKNGALLDGRTTVSIVDGNLIVEDSLGSDSNDAVTIQADFANQQYIITDPGNRFSTSSPGLSGDDSQVILVPFALVTGSILVNTQGGTDNLTVDYSQGNFDRVLNYDGGLGAGDSLTLTGGGTFAEVTHTFDSASAGKVDVAGNALITYLGLEPVTDNLSAIDRIFNFAGGAETITLVDAVGASMKIDSTLGEAVTFANPTASITINAGIGNDTVTLSSVDAAYTGALTVNGDDGNDLLNASALSLGVTLNGGNNNDTLTGGSGNDTLNGGIGDDAHVGNAGSDTFTGSAGADSFNGGAGTDHLIETYSGTATLTSTTFNGNGADTITSGSIEQATFAGSAGDDSLTISLASGNWTIAVDGNGGNDSLTGPNAAAAWNINGIGAGTLTVSTVNVSFSNIGTLQGGTGVDAFAVSLAATAALKGGSGNDIFNVNASLTGSIQGEAGTDTLQGNAIDGVTLVGTVNDGTEADITGGFSGIETFNGNGGFLRGLDGLATWNLAATRTYVSGGTVNFSGFGTLQGGSGTDTFNITVNSTFNLQGGDNNDIFNLAATLTGSIDGEAGADTLQGTLIDAVTLIAGDANGYDGTESSISGGFADVETIVGNGTASLTGIDAASTWDLDGAATYSNGVHPALNFSGFTTLQGGSDVDTFNLSAAGPFTLRGGAGNDVFAIAATLTGSVLGEGGVDTLQGAAINAVVLTASDAAGFDGTEDSISGGLTDLETIAGNGGTLTGQNAVATWSLDGTPTYTVGANSLNFSGFAILQGGSAVDTFDVSTTQSGVTLRGGAGADVLQGTQINAAVLTGSDVTGFGGTENSLAGFADFETILGNGGTLTGQNAAAATWTLDGSPTYTVGANSLNFSGFATLQGGNQTDTFNITADSAFTLQGGDGNDQFTNSARLTGDIDGQGGSDTLSVPKLLDASTWTITGFNSGMVTDLVGTFSNVENLAAGFQHDEFIFLAGGAVSGTISGGMGADTLDFSALSPLESVNVGLTAVGGDGYDGTESRISGGFHDFEALEGNGAASLTGLNAPAAWALDGTPTYTTSGFTLSFSGFATLQGGSQADTFNVTQSTAANLLGGLGNDQFTLSLPTGSTLTGTIDGQGGNDTLSNPKVSGSTTWNITGSGSGEVTDLVGSFAGIESLVAGSDADRFIFRTGGLIAGTINGAGGDDTIDYFNLNTSVNVNLAAGTASHTGGIASFENIEGSQAGDVLTGDGLANTIFGHGGDDTITGAGGNDTLAGGNHQDTLVEFFTGVSSLTDTQYTGNGTDGLSGFELAILTGTTGNETLSLDFTGHVSANAVSGSDTIIGPNQAANWDVDAGSFAAGAKTASFSSFDVLQGGTAADTFGVSASATAVLKGGAGNDVFDIDATLTGSIDGEAGSDTLEGNLIDAVLLTAGNTSGFDGTEASVTGGFADLETVAGNGGILTGLAAPSNWNLNGSPTYVANSATLNFSGFATLQGGAAVDTFHVAADSQFVLRGGSGNDVFHLDANLTGSIHGDGSTGTGDELRGTQIDAVTLGGTANEGTEDSLLAGSFTGIETLVGNGGTLQGRNAAATWNLSAAPTYVSTGTLNFSGFTTLQGGSAVDTFSVTAAFSGIMLRGGAGTDILQGTQIDAVILTNSEADGFDGTASSLGQAGSFTAFETIIGNGGTLQGQDAAATWSLDGTPTYTVGANSLNFSGFATLQGGSDADAFHVTSASSFNLRAGAGSDLFALSATLTGTIDGQAGADTLQGTAIDALTLIAGDANGYDGTEASIIGGFSDVETITGNGSASLTGINTASTWGLDGAATYSNGIHPALNFSGFTTLQGGADIDTFNLAAAGDFTLRGGLGNDVFDIDATLTGSIDGQGGSDTLQGDLIDAVLLTAGDNLNGFDGDEANITADFDNVETIVGNGGTLTGLSVQSTWNLDGSPTYVANSATLSFSGFDTLQGGSNVDTFLATADSQFLLRGGSGNDIFQLDATLTGAIQGEASTGTGDELRGSRIDAVTLGATANEGTELDVTGGFTGIETLTGNGGTLNGRQAAATWNLGASPTYVSNGTLNFSGFATLQGGLAIDTFNITVDNTFDLRGGGDNDVFSLTANLTGSIDGEAGSDTLSRSAVGAANTWTLTSLGSGTVTGLAGGGTYSGIESLTGGTGSDTFLFQPGGSVAGTIAGGTGIDELNYSPLATSVTANLQTGVVAHAGSMSGIENVQGGSAADTLTGDGLVNVLSGNGGNDTLSGLGNNDTLFGGDDDDTLTGGIGNDMLHAGNGASDELVETFAGTSSLTDTQYVGNGTDTISGFERADLTGSAGADTIALDFTGSITVDAISGSDTLIGPGTVGTTATWDVDLGTITTATMSVTFSNFDNLRGGAADDVFVVNAAFTGSIDGGLGSDALQGTEIDVVVVTTGDVPNGFDGTEASITAGFANVEAIHGNGSDSTSIIGDSVASTWDIGVTQTYTINSSTATLTFSGFRNLQGGTSTDVFNVSFDHAINTIHGGLGVDDININASLTYSGAFSLTLTAETIDIGAVTIESQHGNQTYNGALSLAGSTLISTGAGAVVLGGNVTVNAPVIGSAASTIEGKLDLNGVTRTFTVSDATGNADPDLTVEATVQGGSTIGMIKAGDGTMALDGDNTYGGSTTINGGTLLVNGSTAAGTVAVNSGATLGGTGTIGGNVNVNSGGSLSPGPTYGLGTTGILTILGSVTFASGSFFIVEINDDVTPGADYDQLTVAGSVNLGGATLLTTGSIPAVSQNQIVLINKLSSGAFTGTFSGLPESQTILVGSNQIRFRLTHVGSDGNDLVLGADTFVSLGTLGTDFVVTDITNTTDDTLTVWVDETSPGGPVLVIRDTDPDRILTTNITGATGNGTSELRVPLSALPANGKLLVNTGAGQDHLTLDFQDEFTFPVIYDGGDPTGAPGDSLTLTNGSFDTVEYTFVNDSDGTIQVTGNGLVTFKNLDPITDNLVAANRIFNFSDASDTILLQDAPGAGMNSIDSDHAEIVTFLNPTASLTVNAGGGNDDVTVSTLDKDLVMFVSLVTVNGGDDVLENNTLTVATPDAPLATQQFAFAGFTFDQTNTPDVVTVVPLGEISDDPAGMEVTAPPDNPTGAANFPQTTTGFNDELTIGNQLSPPNVDGSRAINLPAGNVGTETRSAIELGWSPSNPVTGLTNAPGDDFVVYESSSNPSGPDGYIVQVHVKGDTADPDGYWTQWRYESPDSRENYGGSSEGAFATAFDLSDFGLAEGTEIDGIRIANLNAGDRIDGPGTETTIGSGEFRGQGFVLLDDGGATSDTFPDPGPLASFDFYGNSTFDPDPLYVAALHLPTETRVDQIHVEGDTVGIATEGVTRPTIQHTGFDTLNVNTFGGVDDISVQLGADADTLPTNININGGDPATADHVTIHGSETAEDALSLQNNTISASTNTTANLISLTAVEKLTIDMRGDNLNDLTTIDRNFTLSGVNPHINVLGDGAPLDRLVVNVEPDVSPSDPQEFSAVGFTFDQNDTPDVLTHLNGANTPNEPIPFGHGALSDTKAFDTGSSNLDPVGLPGFDGDLSIGGLSDHTTGSSTARLLNMPAGNNGADNRSAIELTWSGGRTLANEAGDDFVIYESGSSGSPEGYMVQVHRADSGPGSQENGGWSEWIYVPASAFSSSDSAFVTAFDLSIFGVPEGGTIDAIRIANLTDADRIQGPTGQGLVIPEGIGATAGDSIPDPGSEASFSDYGAGTLDPDPIYLGVLHPLVLPPGGGTSDTVAVDPDSVLVQNFIPITYDGLERVTVNTGGGRDHITVKPSVETAYTINGGDSHLPAEPGDRLEWDLTGLAPSDNALLTITDPGTGQLVVTGRRHVDVTSIDTFGLAPGTSQTYDVVITANSAAGTPAANGTPDTYLVERNDVTTEVSVNDVVVFRGDRTSIGAATINGSSDNDTLTVDFTFGDPIPANDLFFNGQGGTNQLFLRDGTMETVTHTVINGADGRIDLDAALVAPTTIHYTSLTAPTHDDLDTTDRIFNLANTADEIRLVDVGTTTDGRSQLINPVTSPLDRTFVDVQFKNATGTTVVNGAGGNDSFSFEAVDLSYAARTQLNGQGGDDTFRIDDNGAGSRGSVDFVVFPVEIHGGGELNDKLVLNDTSDASGDVLSISEANIGAEAGDTFFGTGGSVQYSGLADLDITTGSGDEQVTIFDDPAINAVSLANPARSFILRTGDGGDAVTIASIDGGYRASTTILGQGGNDSITQLANLTLGSAASAGNLHYEADAIGLNADLHSTGGTATYDGAVQLLSDVRIDTDSTLAGTQGGNILFTANSPIDSEASEFNDLVLDAGTANITALAPIGLTRELDTVLIEQANDVTFASTINTASDVTQAAGTGLTTFSGTGATGDIGGNLDVTTADVLFTTGKLVTVGEIRIKAQNEIIQDSGADLIAGDSSISLEAILGNVSLSRVTTTDTVSVTAGGAILDNLAGEHPTFDANITAFRTDLVAGSGIGGANDADLDTAVAQLTAMTTLGDITLGEKDDIELQGVFAPAGSIRIHATDGAIDILNGTYLQSKTGQVSNAPPLLRLAEINPDDVLVPGDPTQEVHGTIGGDPANFPSDNLEKGKNYTLTVEWDDGTVSTLHGLNAGDDVVWHIGPNGESTAQITPGSPDEPIDVEIQREYPLLYLQTVQAPEVVATFGVENDPNIILTDNSTLNLNETEPLVAIATALAEEQFGFPAVLVLDVPRLVLSEPPPVSFVESSSTPPAQSNAYEALLLTEEENQEEVPVLSLELIGLDGKPIAATKLALSELQNLDKLLERLKNAKIPNGLYRIMYKEPGLPAQKVLEFRKTGNSIGDPLREPGRGTNPVEEQQPANQPEAPPPADENVPEQNEAPAPANGAAADQADRPAQERVQAALASATEQSFTRAARQLRRSLRPVHVR